MKLDWKLTIITIGFFILLNPIYSTIHEYGHAYICWFNGNSFTITPTLFGTYFTCDKFVGDHAEALRTSMYMAGGFMGASTALLTFSVLLGLKLLRGRAKGVGYALVTIGIVHFVQLILETFAHDFYMQGKFTIPILTFASLILLMVFLFRGSKPFLAVKVFVNPPYGTESKFRDDIPQSVFKRDIRDIIKRNKPTPQTTKPVEIKKHTLDILKEFDENGCDTREDD